MKFKVGDKVKYINPRSSMDGRTGEVFIITNSMYGPYYYIDFTGNRSLIKSREDELIHFETDTEEMKLKREELRLKYIHIDPYGEEDWSE